MLFRSDDVKSAEDLHVMTCIECGAGSISQRAHTDHFDLMNRKLTLVFEEIFDIERRKAAVAAYAGGDALKKGERGGIGMTVDMAVRIDEARTDETAGSIDSACVLRADDVSRRGNSGDFIAGNKNVGREGASLLGIDDPAAGNEEFRHEINPLIIIRGNHLLCDVRQRKRTA